MPQVVVTGSNGFIGTNLLDSLLKTEPNFFLQASEGSEQAPPKRNKFPDLGAARNSSQEISFLACDLAESGARKTAARFLGSARVNYVHHDALLPILEALDEPPLAVIHNGACSSTTETRPEVFENLNLGPSKALWRYCARTGVPFIYASSAAVYGDGSKGFSDSKDACDSFVPLNLYGHSKLDFDLWAMAQSECPPTWFGLRYFNVYGPFEAHKGAQASMAYHGYQQITRTGIMKLFKSNSSQYVDGGQQRDFVFVEDVLAITRACLEIAFTRKRLGKTAHPIAGDGLFLNIGTGEPQTWNQLAAALFTTLAIPANIEFIAMPEHLVRQYQNYTCASLESLRHLGIDHGFTSLEDGVRAYVRRYLMRGL